MSRNIDFIVGFGSPKDQKKKLKKLSLCYAYPKVGYPIDESIIQRIGVNPRQSTDLNKLSDDGLYVSPGGPLTQSVVKPYQVGHHRAMDTQTIGQFSHKLLEIAIRQVKIINSSTASKFEIIAILVLFKEKIICKILHPFNRKLYKLLVNKNSESSNLSLRLQSNDGCFSDLPFPLPNRCIKEKMLEIDFAINDHSGRTYSGIVVYTISLSMQEDLEMPDKSKCSYKSTNDPNDPHNSLTLLKVKRKIGDKSMACFQLEDPALKLEPAERGLSVLPDEKNRDRIERKMKMLEVVVIEQAVFSLWDISFGNWFQARRPLRPSTSKSGPKTFRGGRDEVLTITVLRGVEVPIREESALVQPLVQIQWGELIQATSASEGTAPVWQQTMHFGIPKRGQESSIKLSLYDQHPLWGLQWLGEALIPIESTHNENYQQVERWIGLSSLSSPVIRFGYIQASPIRSYTRIYILMRLDKLTNGDCLETNSLDNLSKAIQRCMRVAYKIEGAQRAEDAAKLAMLLTPLPAQYGPLNPRQALKLNKVDHYGRAALLATLLQAFGLEAYVLIASSQARNWAAFVISIDEKNQPLLWDPENGEQYNFTDSRCSIIKVFRMINYRNIWKNLQKTSVISNVKFNTKITKDWQALNSHSASNASDPQIHQLEGTFGTDHSEHLTDTDLEIENQLRDKLSQWRTRMGLTTVFNRHAISLLRTFLTKVSSTTDVQMENKKDLRQLYRAYQIHGFILNLRWLPLEELFELLGSTKIQEVTGPVEFALVCHLQRYVGKTSSLWLAVVILRSID